jgi:glutamyl-tRNA synthetase
LKFADVAFEHLKNPELMTLEDYATAVTPFLQQRGLPSPDPSQLARAIETVRPRARSLVDAAASLDFYFREPPELDLDAADKFLIAPNVPLLHGLLDRLRAAPEWRAELLEADVKLWSEQAGLKMKDIAQPARVALTGKAASPGLFEVMGVLGRTRSLERLERALARARS